MIHTVPHDLIYSSVQFYGLLLFFFLAHMIAEPPSED
jgi:hypothetical protein